MFVEWQQSISTQLQSLTTTIKLKGKLKLSNQEKQMLRDIDKTLQKIRFDGSSGIHNYMFMDELLTELKEKISSIGKDQTQE